jgi:TonB-dependent SusC/RagA subfamily outer membrane receptor
MGRILLLLLLASANALAQTSALEPTIKISENREQRVVIRCGRTMQDTSPLCIIDGCVVDSSALRQMDPNDILRIDVLKDGMASAVYGCRATNGVILITTKRIRHLAVRDYDSRSRLEGASARVIKSKKSAESFVLIADKNGEIDLSALQDNQEYELEVSCIGYKTKNISVTKREYNHPVELEKDYKKMDSVVVVSYMGTRCKRCGGTCSGVITQNGVAEQNRNSVNSFSVYPNPASRSGAINIKLPEQVTGKIEIINAAGQVVKTENLSTDQVVYASIHLDNASAGTYFVRFTTVYHKTFTQKLVVQ